MTIFKELLDELLGGAQFNNEETLERPVSAVLVETDERWAVDTKAYIKWEYQDV